jgi:hypothetical protein
MHKPNGKYMLSSPHPFRWGQAVAQLVEALRCKAEGHGFDSQWGHWNFSLTCSFLPPYGSGVN